MYVLHFSILHMQVNIRAKQRASFKQVSEKKTPVREDKQALGSVYHDSRMAQISAQRSRKQFKFNEPGTKNLVMWDLVFLLVPPKKLNETFYLYIVVC